MICICYLVKFIPKAKLPKDNIPLELALSMTDNNFPLPLTIVYGCTGHSPQEDGILSDDIINSSQGIDIKSSKDVDSCKTHKENVEDGINDKTSTKQKEVDEASNKKKKETVTAPEEISRL